MWFSLQGCLLLSAVAVSGDRNTCVYNVSLAHTPHPSSCTNYVHHRCKTRQISFQASYGLTRVTVNGHGRSE